MNCLNGFRIISPKNKHIDYYSSNGKVKVKMAKREKWLKFHDRQYQFEFPFMLPLSFRYYKNKQK